MRLLIINDLNFRGHGDCPIRRSLRSLPRHTWTSMATASSHRLMP